MEEVFEAEDEGLVDDEEERVFVVNSVFVAVAVTRTVVSRAMLEELPILVPAASVAGPILYCAFAEPAPMPDAPAVQDAVPA